MSTKATPAAASAVQLPVQGDLAATQQTASDLAAADLAAAASRAEQQQRLAALARTPVRMLRATQVDDVSYGADAPVEFPAGLADALTADGAADPHPEAVAYALSLGQVLLQHPIASTDAAAA